jgi:hypothetical protein
MIYIQVRTARPRAPLGRERWQKEVALLKRKIKEKSQALGIFLLKSLCRKEVDKVATTVLATCQTSLTRLTRRAFKNHSTRLWSVSDHLSSKPLPPLQHGHGGQSLTGRDSRTPCDRVAFRKGTPSTPTCGSDLPAAAELALHETRLSLCLQSKPPPPSNA